MKIFYTALVCALAALVVLSVNSKRESTNFYGIADTKEMVINAEFGVEIKNMRITPGQQVFEGDTLVEMRSPEIDLKISEFTHLINEMKTRSKTQANLSKSEMRTLKSEQEARMIEIRSELQQLESQYEINRQLMQKLRSLNSSDTGVMNAGSKNPTLIKIHNLKQELERLDRSNAIMDENLHSQISFGVDPIKEMLKQYEDQLRLYTELEKKLYIIAKSNGVVGTVFYKKGEMVSAFDSIATIHSQSPSYVLGYIHENIYSSVSLGQRVKVRSLADSKSEVDGEVVGVGTRIVEYPIRLRKVPELIMWGREVTIRIPDENKFLLGEKVVISIENEKSIKEKGLKSLSDYLPTAKAIADTATVRSPGAVIDISRPGSSAVGIEASGALFMEDIQKYCIISDESSMLYLMNRRGQIEKEVQIEGLKKANDMEGITSDDRGNIYIVCSQSPNKKGNHPDTRKLLMRIRRKGDAFVLDGYVKLIDLLTEVAKSDSAASWINLVKIDMVNRSPDIEGIAYNENTLYLSFKSPLLDEKSAILKITDIDNMFKSGSLEKSQIELWRQLHLKDISSGNLFRISDIQFTGNNLYILSCCISGDEPLEGRLWVLRANGEDPEVIKSFQKMKPEGIAFDKKNSSAIITFDNGSDLPSQFTVLKGVL
ncbi:MAG: hypothetical protein GX556_02065 [Fibrobacter sp.]|nr:hypothetical protein [Fibrobacter sp.]